MTLLFYLTTLVSSFMILRKVSSGVNDLSLVMSIILPAWNVLVIRRELQIFQKWLLCLTQWDIWMGAIFDEGTFDGDFGNSLLANYKKYRKKQN